MLDKYEIISGQILNYLWNINVLKYILEQI